MLELLTIILPIAIEEVLNRFSIAVSELSYLFYRHLWASHYLILFTVAQVKYTILLLFCKSTVILRYFFCLFYIENSPKIEDEKNFPVRFNFLDC